jgi:hypothetical protein
VSFTVNAVVDLGKDVTTLVCNNLNHYFQCILVIC